MGDSPLSKGLKMSASVIDPGMLSNYNSNHKSQLKNRGSANANDPAERELSVIQDTETVNETDTVMDDRAGSG